MAEETKPPWLSFGNLVSVGSMVFLALSIYYALVNDVRTLNFKVADLEDQASRRGEYIAQILDHERRMSKIEVLQDKTLDWMRADDVRDEQVAGHFALIERSIESLALSVDRLVKSYTEERDDAAPDNRPR